MLMDYFSGPITDAFMRRSFNAPKSDEQSANNWGPTSRIYETNHMYA